MSASDQAPAPESPPRCDQCGAPVPPAAAGATPPDDEGEAVTHCEWCGAEYAVPERG